MRTKVLILSIGYLFTISAGTFAQSNNHSSCGDNCFTTEIIGAEKTGENCTAYEFKVSYIGDCDHALSHYTVAIPCGKIKNLSNSKKWDQEFGYDPKTKLYGFKIDDIHEFGKTSLESFIVKFTLCDDNSRCSDNRDCSEVLSCWEPVVAYKAATCIYYDTLAAPCASPFAATLQKKDASCYGAQDGELSVVIEEGEEPFTFEWSTGATTQSINGLSAGIYSVIVKDASGEELNLQEEITQPSQIEITGEITNASCGGQSNGAIDITASGGKGGYTYSWHNGATIEDLSGLIAGTYIVTVKDSTGCTSQSSFTVTNTSQITITASSTPPDCTESNGSINITVNGGTAPYTYQWSNGSTTEDIQNIGAGLYTVKITDANGCTAETTYNIKVNNTLKLTVLTTPTSCLDDGSGAIDLTVTGGTAPYTYSWANGETSEDLSGLNTGSYTVTVTDAKGCTASLRVFVPLKTFQVSSQVIQPLCHGDSTGSITLNPFNGIAPYTFEWSTGETGNSVSGLAPGIYSVIIRDDSGCTRELIFVIIDPPAIEASASVSNDQCNADGSFNIDLSVSGGKPPYSFEWSNGETSEDLDSLAAGNYTVKITDANGCSVTKEIQISGAEQGWSCAIIQPDSVPVCGTVQNVLQTSVSGADSYLWSVESSDGSWTITSGSTSNSIIYTAGNSGTSATFILTIEKDGCSQTCSYQIGTCSEDPDDGDDDGDDGDDDDDGDGDDDGDDDGDGGNETCEECFDSGIKLISDNGQCRVYEVIVSTNGNCRHDLSHWDIAIPCGYVKDYYNSEGWKMDFGKDPTTGLYGLKVDDIDHFGSNSESFKVRFKICYDNDCEEKLDDWSPVVAYKAGQCVGYDTLTVDDETDDDPQFSCTAYPNPFTDHLNFEWTADEDDYVAIEMLDQLGNRMTTVYTGKVRKGQVYKIDWTGLGLKDNLYFYRYTSTKRTVHGKLFKTR